MNGELTDYDELRKNPAKFVEEIIGDEPFDYQRKILNSDSKRRVFVAGRQVGKSRTCAWMGLHHALTHRNHTVLITADALRQSSELFSQLRSEMSEAGISDDLWGVERDTQTVVEFDNGSRILCLPTGRDGSKIRGYTADMIIVDEAAFIDDVIFEDVLWPMTFVTGGTIVLASTPWGSSGFFYEKAQAAEEEDSDWMSVHASSYDNPMIDPSDIDEFKEGKTQTQIKQEVLGEFVPEGSTFFAPELVRNCMVTEVERTTDEVVLAADLASSGPDETVLVMMDYNGNAFAIEQHDMSPMEAAKRIKQLDMHYDFKTIMIDESGLGEGPVEMLREQIGRKVKSEYLSIQKKQSLYQTLKAEMERGNIHFPHNKDARYQLENLGFKKTKSGNLSIHAKGSGHDDIPDALALAAWALPGTEGSTMTGHRGMMQPVEMGGLEEDQEGNRYLSFNEQEDTSVERATVRTS